MNSRDEFDKAFTKMGAGFKLYKRWNQYEESAAWIAWQASREQMKKECIEACNNKLIKSSWHLKDTAINYAIDDCVKAIEALE